MRFYLCVQILWLFYDLQLHIHQPCKAADLFQEIAGAEREMVGRTCFAPAGEEIRDGRLEYHSGIGVSRLGDFARLRGYLGRREM